jgi:amidophosphoribosyltransferase
VLLNVLADEIHRAHQRCLLDGSCDPHKEVQRLVFEAGAATMGVLQGAYACICLVKGVGLVAFRDPYGIRCAACGRGSGVLAADGARRTLIVLRRAACNS